MGHTCVMLATARDDWVPVDTVAPAHVGVRWVRFVPLAISSREMRQVGHPERAFAGTPELFPAAILADAAVDPCPRVLVARWRQEPLTHGFGLVFARNGLAHGPNRPNVR
jgi:hypothetical protein